MRKFYMYKVPSINLEHIFSRLFHAMHLHVMPKYDIVMPKYTYIVIPNINILTL